MAVRLRECLDTYNEHLAPGEEPMTQARLAQTLGVSEAAVSRWASDIPTQSRDMGTAMAARIARLLGCSLDDFLISDDYHPVNQLLADPGEAPEGDPR